jgi:photosystem II stability/assembly factor-like uncharacterized protein
MFPWFALAAGLLTAGAALRTHADSVPLNWWHVRGPTLPRHYLQAVVFGPAGFVSVGFSGSILSSADGMVWEDRSLADWEHLYDLTYGNGVYVAVGPTRGFRIFTSRDGVGWTNWPSRITNGTPYGCTYGNDVFVAVSRGTDVSRSYDGTNWTHHFMTNSPVFAVTHGNGLFVAVGDVIVTSPDGINWSLATSIRPRRLFSAVYGGGQFVAAGRDGLILTSPEGLNWTTQSSGTTVHLREVVYANETFLIVGDGGTILTSDDGRTWTPQSSGTTRNLIGANVGPESVIVVGDAGTILQSDPLSPSPPGIRVQPMGQNIAQGDAVRFDAGVFGTSPLQYQWFHDTGPVSNATNASLVISNVQAAREGSYWAVVSNALGSATSAVARLSVCMPPVVLQSPLIQGVVLGGHVTFGAETTGSPSFIYRWRQPTGVWVTNALTESVSFLTITNVQSNHYAGVYFVIVSNSCGMVTSAPAYLKLLSDFDHDRLADDWESFYGLDTNTVNNANDDPDHDTMTNIEEYEAGTDPTSGASVLKIDTIHFRAEPTPQVLLGFDAVSNRTYSVLYADVLPAMSWMRAADLPARRTNWQAQITDILPLQASTRFYRLQTPAGSSSPAVNAPLGLPAGNTSAAGLREQ